MDYTKSYTDRLKSECNETDPIIREVVNEVLRIYKLPNQNWDNDYEMRLTMYRNIAKILASLVRPEQNMVMPSEEEIKKESKKYGHNSMSSMAEGTWMPEGFKEGAKWVLAEIKRLNPKNSEG